MITDDNPLSLILSVFCMNCNPLNRLGLPISKVEINVAIIREEMTFPLLKKVRRNLSSGQQYFMADIQNLAKNG